MLLGAEAIRGPHIVKHESTSCISTHTLIQACNRPLLPSTVPSDSEGLHDSANLNPEGQCVSSNPHLILGAEGQSQRLCAAGSLKLETAEGEGGWTDGRWKMSSIAEDSYDRSREDTTDDGDPEYRLETQTPAPAPWEAPSAHSAHA
ncbi:hypothetical protein NDU88_002630 [Pleurodeles waltl]|uniref:Uncharacterized protein n=1 Tax=Pleurodeles waltl TaxID=8319 RepID=A0AAV7SES5_PLEWA|nr:hypothetical protein NDU88_002630 [Pleurodeles waltl]